MSVIKQTITDAEYEIMCILWRSEEKLTVADIIKELDNNDWTASTVATFMARLLKKGVIFGMLLNTHVETFDRIF